MAKKKGRGNIPTRGVWGHVPPENFGWPVQSLQYIVMRSI